MAFGVCAPTDAGGGPGAGRRRVCGLRPQTPPARRPGPADGRARFARPPPPPARLRRAGRQLPAGVHANGIVCGGLLIARESGGSQWPGLPFGVCAPAGVGGTPGAGRRRFCGLRPQNQPIRRPGPADGRARVARPAPRFLRRPGRGAPWAGSPAVCISPPTGYTFSNPFAGSPRPTGPLRICR